MNMRISLRFESRDDVPFWLRVLRPFLSVTLALFVGGIFLRLAGLPPLDVYCHILSAAFGSTAALSDTLVKATPVILCGVGGTFAFRGRLWNIGLEGQLLLGAWAATGVALVIFPPSTPRPLMLCAMGAAGFLCGALWASLPGFLRARFGTNEIITTLMLSYVATQWINAFVFVLWSEQGFQMTPQLPKNAWLPRLSDTDFDFCSGLTVHLGFLVSLGAAVLSGLLLARTRLGFELRVLGDNPRAAMLSGMNMSRTILWAMLLSGGFAGLAGACEIAGVVHRLQDRFSPGYGFSGIIVAWLSRQNPLIVIPVSILFGGLLVGGKEIQPGGIPHMLQGIILFVVVASERATEYRLRIVRHSRQTHHSHQVRRDAGSPSSDSDTEQLNKAQTP